MELNDFKERFILGFCQAATPFSAKKGFENGLRLRAKRIFEEKSPSFMGDNLASSAGYFGGGVLGLVCVPVDAIMVAVGDVKRTLKIL